MFGSTLECGIRAVKVRTKNVDGRTLRRCRVVLAHEFTEAIARELGDDAKALREGLRALAIDKAVLPIDGLAAIGAFTSHESGEVIEIKRMTGVKATCIAPKGDSEDGPTIQLEFEFSWDERAWVFLGRHSDAAVEVVLTQRQLVIASGATA